MGFGFSKSYGSNVRIYDCIPPGYDFYYLRPNGTIMFSIEGRYNAPVLDLRFDGWHKNSARLWPKDIEQSECVLLLDRTLLQTLSKSSPDDCGIDTIS